MERDERGTEALRASECVCHRLRTRNPPPTRARGNGLPSRDRRVWASTDRVLCHGRVLEPSLLPSAHSPPHSLSPSRCLSPWALNRTGTIFSGTIQSSLSPSVGLPRQGSTPPSTSLSVRSPTLSTWTLLKTKLLPVDGDRLSRSRMRTSSRRLDRRFA